MLRDLRSLSFEYYGWASVEERGGDVRATSTIDSTSGGLPRWWPEYDGMKTFQHPLKVALNIDEQRTFFEFADRSDAVLQAVKAD